MRQARLAAAIAAAREQVEAMRSAHAHRDDVDVDQDVLLDKLATAFEELSAAEQELRAQGDELAATGSVLEAGLHRYQDLFEFMPDGYLVTDESGVIREANKAALALLSPQRQTVVGRPITSFVSPSERARVRRQLATAKGGDGHGELEVTLHRRGLPPLAAALTVAAVRGDDHRRDGFRLLVRDISERRKAEESARAASAAHAANEAKDEFLATLSHELRNPLNAIVGWSGILRSETLPLDQLAMALETIDRNALQLNRLVSDLLDVARIAQRKLHFEQQPCDLTAVTAGAFDAIRSELMRRRQRFSAKVHDPGAVLADPTRLQQIVSNLLGNAVKFTPPGGLVALRLEAVEPHIEIVVRDTGTGIEPELLPHVFERFRQGDAARTERGGGLGLGLPIARTLARMHGGDLWVDSAGVGRGSTFTVQIPLLRPAQAGSSDALRESLDLQRSHLQPLRGFRVLVVGPDPRTAEEVAHHIAAAGVTARAACSPTLLIEPAGEFIADAVVVVVPPSQEGSRLLAETAAVQKALGGALPLLAITPSTATARRWLGLPAEIQLCTSGDLEPTLLPTRLAVLAQISGWVPPR